MILTCKFWLAGCVVHHLYDVCVTVQFKFIPDPRYPQITLEIQDAMRRRGVTVCVCVVCEIWMFFVVLNVADKMKSVCARFVEMDFDLSSSSFDLLFRCWLLRSTTWCIFFFIILISTNVFQHDWGSLLMPCTVNCVSIQHAAS
jgi:hypothetical protein